jgi:probable phosphoglycerate mutase
MSRPERVWLVRHAETTAAHVFNGAESDVDLSETGYQQARAAADWFQSHGISAVVSSRMIRAIKTAEPIAARSGVPHFIEDHLHERRVGILCGQEFSFVDGIWAETIREWSSGNVHFTSEGAESFAEMADRLIPAWNRVMAAHPGGRIVVVAHGVAVKVLLLSLLKGWHVTHWQKMGRVANLAVAELKPSPCGAWEPHGELLTQPEPIAQITAISSASDPPGVRKSSA